jgi:hypothetical protein
MTAQELPLVLRLLIRTHSLIPPPPPHTHTQTHTLTHLPLLLLSPSMYTAHAQMRAIGLLAIAAGAMAQTAPKIQSLNDNMVVNAVAGDVVFNTDGGATTSISTITAALDNVPNMINTAVTTATNNMQAALTSAVTPLSTTVASQGNAIATQATNMAAYSTQMAAISSNQALLLSNAVQYVPSNSQCNAANQGRVRLINNLLQYCVGTTWRFTYEEPMGTSRGSAAPDCQAIADADDAPASGIRTVWIEMEAGSSDNIQDAGDV